MITKSSIVYYIFLTGVLVLAADAWRRSWYSKGETTSQQISPIRKEIRELKRDMDEMGKLWLEQQSVIVKVKQQLKTTNDKSVDYNQTDNDKLPAEITENKPVVEKSTAEFEEGTLLAELLKETPEISIPEPKTEKISTAKKVIPNTTDSNTFAVVKTVKTNIPPESPAVVKTVKTNVPPESPAVVKTVKTKVPPESPAVVKTVKTNVPPAFPDLNELVSTGITVKTDIPEKQEMNNKKIIAEMLMPNEDISDEKPKTEQPDLIPDKQEQALHSVKKKIVEITPDDLSEMPGTQTNKQTSSVTKEKRVLTPPKRVTTVPAKTAEPIIEIPGDVLIEEKTDSDRQYDDKEVRTSLSQTMLSGRAGGTRLTMSEILEAYDEPSKTNELNITPVK